MQIFIYVLLYYSGSHILPFIADAFWILTADALTAAHTIFQSQHVSLTNTSLCLNLHFFQRWIFLFNNFVSSLYCSE